MNPGSQLLLEEARWPAGGDWTNPHHGWHAGLLRRGVVYIVGRSPAEELAPGDVFLLSPGCPAILRASQLGDAVVTAFNFSPERLAGLLSLSEHLSMDKLAQRQLVKVVRATEPAAREFATLAAGEARRHSFVQRCQLLNLIAMLIGPDLPEATVTSKARAMTLCHFDKLIMRLSEADLLNCSSEQLARMCGCSVRHFRRVFRRHFNTSIRSKQTELRLQRASDLLLETDQPVIKVATASGYNHFGLFSATFKKRFGMTPSEWRRHHAAAA